MKKILLTLVLVLVVGIGGFMAYAMMKAKPKRVRPHPVAEQTVPAPAPEMQAAATTPTSEAPPAADTAPFAEEDLAMAAVGSVDAPVSSPSSVAAPAGDALPAAATGGAAAAVASASAPSVDMPPPAPAAPSANVIGSEPASADGTGPTTPPAAAPETVAAPLAESAPGVVPPSSAPEVSRVAEATEARAASTPKKAATVSSTASLRRAWRRDPHDTERASLDQYATSLSAASTTTLLAHTDFVERSPGVYTAMLLWNGPTPDLQVEQLDAGLAAVQVNGARLAADLPPSMLSSFTSGTRSGGQRFVYGGFGRVTVDVAKAQKSAIVTVRDSAPRARAGFDGGPARVRNLQRTAVVAGDAPAIRRDVMLSDDECSGLTTARLRAMAQAGMPLDQCLNVVYSSNAWTVQAVTSHGAILQRGARILPVSVGSMIPDMGQVIRLDPAASMVVTTAGTISSSN